MKLKNLPARAIAWIACLFVFATPLLVGIESEAQQLGKLNGVWEAPLKTRFGSYDDYRLIVESNRAWLQIFGQKYYLLPLIVEKPEGEGVIFRVNSDAVRELEFSKVRAIPSAPGYRGAPDRLNFALLAPDNRLVRAVMFTKLIVPTGDPLRLYLGEAPVQSFIYQDWQSARQGANSGNEAEDQNRLKQAVGRSGWKCLSRVTQSVTQDRKLIIPMQEPGGDRRYLIYSPQGNGNLVYGFASRPSEYALIAGAGTNYDYPVAVMKPSSLYTATREITFKLLPSIIKPSPAQVTVTVFVFGTGSDYGSGCGIDLNERPVAGTNTAPRRDDRPVQTASTTSTSPVTNSPAQPQATPQRMVATSPTPTPTPTAKVPTQEMNRSSAAAKDRFFAPQVYSALRSGGEVDGSVISSQQAGKRLNRDQVAAVALEKFLQAANSKGIPQNEVTKAIFEGRLNPDFEDLQLAWEGLGKPSAGQYRGMNQTGGSPQEQQKNLERMYAFHRNTLWIQRFGSIANVGVVKTFINGQEVRRSGKDLLLRLLMVLYYDEKPDNFLQVHHQPFNVNLTYDQMVTNWQQIKKTTPARASNVDYAMQGVENTFANIARIHSAYSYFELVAKSPGFQFRKDYDDLRARLYLPSAATTLANTSVAPSTVAPANANKSAPAVSPTAASPTTTVTKAPTPSPNTSSSGPNDRLFAPQVYNALRSGGALDGSLLGTQYAGTQMNREQVAAVALERFVKAATDKGIAQQDITKAMFEGRFNLDFEDVRLAWEGLVQPQPVEAQPAPPANVGGNVRRGTVTQRPRLPVRIDFQRNKMWDQRFGALANMNGVRTIVNGQEVSRIAQDMLLRLAMHRTKPEDFQGFYNRNVDPNLTYSQMKAHIQNLQMPAFEIKYRLESIDKDIQDAAHLNSAFSYFELTSKACCPGFDFRKDYEDLRAKRNRPATQPAVAKASPAPSTAAPLSSNKATSTAAPSAANTTKASSAVAAKGTCDDLAAHPEDKGRVGAGIVDEQIMAGAAIEKCAIALKQSPNEARFYFQLGRAHWAAKQYTEALDAFLKAEERKYAPAYFYLAQAYEQGLIEGEQADPATARNLYMIAASEGFEPAVRAYQGDASVEPDFSEFKEPVLLKALYEGNLDELNKDRRSTLPYLEGIYNLLTEKESFEGFDPTCNKLVDPSIPPMLRRAVRVEVVGLPPEINLLTDASFALRCFQQRSCLETTRLVEAKMQAGTDDILLFAYDYGTCEGAAVAKIHETIKRFMLGSPARP